MVCNGIALLGGAALNDYLIAGLHIRSDVCLSEAQDNFDEQATPDVVIRDRCQDCDLADFVELSPVLWAGPNGLTRIEIPSVASLLILGGRFIGIVRQPEATDDDLRCLLLGPGLGIISIQREAIPVACSCIRVGEAAIALIGQTATSKSSLAIGLAQRGYEILSDDLGIFKIADGIPSILPTTEMIKLWEVTLDELNVPYFDLSPTRKLQRRYFYKPTSQNCTAKGPVPLKKLYFVEKSDCSAITALSPKVAAERLSKAVKHQLLINYFGLAKSIATQVFQITEALPCMRLARDLASPIYGDIAMLEDDAIR